MTRPVNVMDRTNEASGADAAGRADGSDGSGGADKSGAASMADRSGRARASRASRADTTGRAAADYASRSVTRHLIRGAIGLAVIAGSMAAVPFAGPLTLLAAPLGLIAFRGCPTCWAIGLAQTISRGRLERECGDGVCTLTKAPPRTRTNPRG
ncbi:hypothetical protein [Streptomyces sp. CA-111067]|uniref:hypothetical protein n=1 Tax=Streptomyces sp. CA-111067 TaxID=3240046 RepID=UPI003D95F127